MPNTSTQSYWPARERARGELQRRRAARAARFDVDDRHAGTREGAEHLVPRGHTAVRGAAERGLERRVTGFAQRVAHGLYAHLRDGGAVKTPERMHADTADDDARARRRGAHRATGANAHTTSSVPSSSAPTTSVTSSIGWPNTRRAGSASVSRVITRSASRSSSTTPNPYGTGPS